MQAQLLPQAAQEHLKGPGEGKSSQYEKYMHVNVTGWIIQQLSHFLNTIQFLHTLVLDGPYRTVYDKFLGQAKHLFDLSSCTKYVNILTLFDQGGPAGMKDQEQVG